MSWLFGVGSEENSEESLQDSVQILIQRIKTASLYEDRKNAIEKLVELSSENAKVFIIEKNY